MTTDEYLKIKKEINNYWYRMALLTMTGLFTFFFTQITQIKNIHLSDLGFGLSYFMIFVFAGLKYINLSKSSYKNEKKLDKLFKENKTYEEALEELGVIPKKD